MISKSNRERLSLFMIPKIKNEELFKEYDIPNYLPDKIIDKEIFEEHSVIDMTDFLISNNFIPKIMLGRFIDNWTSTVANSKVNHGWFLCRTVH